MKRDKWSDDKVANLQFRDWPFWLAVMVSVAVCLFALVQWQKIARETPFKPLLIEQSK